MSHPMARGAAALPLLASWSAHGLRRQATRVEVRWRRDYAARGVFACGASRRPLLRLCLPPTSGSDDLLVHISELYRTLIRAKIADLGTEKQANDVISALCRKQVVPSELAGSCVCILLDCIAAGGFDTRIPSPSKGQQREP